MPAVHHPGEGRAERAAAAAASADLCAVQSVEVTAPLALTAAAVEAGLLALAAIDSVTVRVCAGGASRCSATAVAA